MSKLRSLLENTLKEYITLKHEVYALKQNAKDIPGPTLYYNGSSWVNSKEEAILYKNKKEARKTLANLIHKDLSEYAGPSVPDTKEIYSKLLKYDDEYNFLVGYPIDYSIEVRPFTYIDKNGKPWNKF